MDKCSTGFFGRRAATALALMLVASVCAGAIQDEIFSDDFEGFDHPACDTGLASDSTDATQYAAAMDLCATTTELGTTPGLITAIFSLSSGAGTPAIVSRAIRSTFGLGLPFGVIP